MSISNCAVLVELNISVWTAQVTARDVSDKVASDNHASHDAGKYTKNLMAGTTLRKSIADYAALCRTWHNGRTLPWHDKGARLLPTSMFLDYKTEANAREAHFNALKDKFVAQYANLMATAQASLGSMFDASDYPAVGEVADKFGFRLVFSPVPEAGDFRLTVGEEDLAELRAQYDTAYDARVGDAVKTTWAKLHDTLKGMSEKLTDNPDGKAKLFHGTWASNVREMCALLGHLNITQDPKLEQARRELVAAMGTLDVDDLKSDVGVRMDLKAKVDAAISRYSEW